MNRINVLRLMYAHAEETDDNEDSVAVMRAAQKLEHLGEAFAEDLTEDEELLIARFIP